MIGKSLDKGIIKRSLNSKAFIITLLLTMGIGLAVLLAGFTLYLSGVSNQFVISTWNLANAEAAVLEQTDYRSMCDEILEVYDSISEADKADPEKEAYLSKFDHLRDERFTKVQESMHSLQNRNGPLNSFIVALDGSTDRMIYLCDADQDVETNYRPGMWEAYEHEQIETLIKGEEATEYQLQMGVDQRVQAVMTNLPRYGPRCTAAATLYKTDKYTIAVCVDEKLEPLENMSKTFLIQYIGLLIAVTLLASFIGMSLMRYAMVKPINEMAKAANEYGSDKDKQNGIKHFDDLNIHTGDELERLADTLRDMETDVEDYMDNLTKATADKERMNVELDLAARIQRGMLTDVFPPFPDRNEFDIYATMEPAREIGGDFYDMILIDDDHLAIEIADVSGKGIPAALFMMASKIMLADGTRDCLSPAEILRDINEKISAGNREEMFVTVWLAILEISTGKLTCANAGHEYPILIHADGRAELIRDKHGAVIGALEGMKYTDYEIMMQKGDRIFVYTDGVTEATSTQNELFGKDRIIKAMGTVAPEEKPGDIMKKVRDAIRDFTVDAKQFDDLTMLCMEYCGGRDEKS